MGTQDLLDFEAGKESYFWILEIPFSYRSVPNEKLPVRTGTIRAYFENPTPQNCHSDLMNLMILNIEIDFETVQTFVVIRLQLVELYFLGFR